MAEKDFDEAFAWYDDLEGHTFVLGGEKFHTVPVSTPESWLAMRSEQGLDGTIAYLRKMLVPEDVERFTALIDNENRDVLISAHQVDQVALWLLEVASGRPTKAPGRSNAGRAPISDSS